MSVTWVTARRGLMAAGLAVMVAAAAPEPAPDPLPGLLADIESAYRSGDFDRGLALVKKVLELKQTDVTTLDRVGSIYYRLGRYGEALGTWQSALPLEKNRRRRRQLQDSITVARRTLGLAPEAAPALEKKPPALPPPPPAAPPDPRTVEALYKQGVKHYAKGEYLQATSAFLRVLELDPSHAKAKAALERLHLWSAP